MVIPPHFGGTVCTTAQVAATATPPLLLCWGSTLLANIMATDVSTDVLRHLTRPSTGSSQRSGTTNLVRLLREAEEGKGLGTDYAEALGEALRQELGGDAPTTSRERQKYQTLLTNVHSLGRKRYDEDRVHVAVM